jgi:hypothetical protein
VWVGPLTIVLAVVVNLVVHSFAVSFFGVSASFPYVQAPVIIITTVVFLVLALLVFVLVGRVSSHPVRSFRIVGGIALVLGLFIWIANIDLTDIHMLFGIGAIVLTGLIGARYRTLKRGAAKPAVESQALS